MSIIFFAVCFLASIVGAICGIGGGVIIKPVLDAFGVLDVKVISFLSGCTVLSMTTYSVLRSRIGGESHQPCGAVLLLFDDNKDSSGEFPVYYLFLASGQSDFVACHKKRTGVCAECADRHGRRRNPGRRVRTGTE